MNSTRWRASTYILRRRHQFCSCLKHFQTTCACCRCLTVGELKHDFLGFKISFRKRYLHYSLFRSRKHKYFTHLSSLLQTTLEALLFITDNEVVYLVLFLLSKDCLTIFFWFTNIFSYPIANSLCIVVRNLIK